MGQAKLNTIVEVHNCLVINIFIRTVAMCELKIIDLCSGICSGENETYFTNNAMYNLVPRLFQMIGKYGQRRNIAVHHQFLSLGSSQGVICGAVRVRSICTIF